MTRRTRTRFDADQLRRRAEAVVGAPGELAELPSPAEVRQVMHDLSVYQIELEMQNDELQRVQEDLEASRARYLDLFEHAPVAYIVFDADGRLRDANDAAANLLGVPTGTLDGRLFSDFIDPADQDTFYRRRRQLLRDGLPQVYELRLRVADAGTRWVRVDVSVDRGDVGARVGRAALTDVTERVAAELEIARLNRELEARVVSRTAALTTAMGDLETFSYSVSHDLRAPLRAVASFAEILDRRYGSTLDAQGQHYLDNILEAGAHMGVLIEELLEYSRLGRGQVRREPVPLEPILERLTTTFAERIAATGTTLELATPLAVPLGDPLLVEQILANLLDNALTYRRTDVTPQVTIAAVRGGDTVALSIADNGIGIAQAHQEKIFEVFARLHRDDEYPGTGIGLATVRKSARLMGSDVTLTSVEGEGTTFTFVLPAAIQEHEDT